MLIALGTLALWLVNNNANFHIRVIDALFTITSAVCVTGLAVVDTGKDISFGGQLVLLLCIQLGGLGVTTATTALPMLLGVNFNFRARMLIAGGLGMDTPQGAVRLLRMVLKYTIIIELIFMLPLFIGFMRTENFLRALYLALFHSVSAFCNAGFSTYSNNLEGFYDGFFVPFSVMALIIAGGIGFPVLFELQHFMKNKGDYKFSPYAKLVMYTTSALLVLGTALFYFSEMNEAFAGMPEHLQWWNALFAAVTPRTAGFDTVSYAKFSGMGIAVTIFLMFVGASPSSTGGGIKTTTFGVLIRASWCEIRNHPNTTLWQHEIPSSTERKAISVATVYLTTLFIGILILDIVDAHPFEELIFEAFSAMGTVGLSMGLTPHLTDAGKIVIILLMFWGRVGIVAFLFGIFAENKPISIHYPETKLPIG